MALDENIYKLRLEKLKAIEALGQATYRSKYEFTHTVGQILADYTPKTAEELENPRLSRSLLLGLLVLACFPPDGSFLPVKEAARILDASASTTHRYCKTLVAVGLLERDPRTRRYRQPV